jgi:hypothetical protein
MYDTATIVIAVAITIGVVMVLRPLWPVRDFVVDRRALPDRRPDLGVHPGHLRRQPHRSRHRPRLPVTGIAAATIDEVFAVPGTAEKIITLGGHAPNYPLPGPGRREVLAAIGT